MTYFLEGIVHFFKFFYLFRGFFIDYKENLEKVFVEKNLDLFKYIFLLEFYTFKLTTFFKVFPCTLRKFHILELEMLYFFQYFFQLVRVYITIYLKEVLNYTKNSIGQNKFNLEKLLCKLEEKNIKGDLLLLKGNVLEKFIFNYSFKEVELSYFFRRNFIKILNEIKTLNSLFILNLSDSLKKDVNYLHLKHYMTLRNLLG